MAGDEEIKQRIADAARRRLASSATRTPTATVKLPTHGSGGVLPGVDLSRNASLEDVLDGREPPRR